MARAGIGRSLEGVHAVDAALRAGRVTHLTIDRRRSDNETIVSLIGLARSVGVSVDLVDDVRSMAVTTAPQGVIASARPLPSRTLDDLLLTVSPPALLVLDKVQDPRNVGAAARSALAAGMGGMIVAERRSAPLNAAAFKAAAGALERLGVAFVGSIAEAIRRLRDANIWTVGLEENAEQSLFGLSLLSNPVAVVIGAEGKGLSRLVRDRVDVLACIPMTDSVESLNVSTAATLAVFEVARVRAG